MGSKPKIKSLLIISIKFPNAPRSRRVSPNCGITKKYSAPVKQGGKYFYYKNDGLQNQSVLYVADSAADKGRVLLDPNKLSTDGTVALNGTAFSDDGKILAYGLSSAGSDWQEWKFRSVETGEDLPDVLKDIKFSGASWTKDGKGVYYSTYPRAAEKDKLTSVNYYQKLFFPQTRHRADRRRFDLRTHRRQGNGCRRFRHRRRQNGWS